MVAEARRPLLLAPNHIVCPAQVGLVARPCAQEILARHLGIAGADIQRAALVFLDRVDHLAQLAHQGIDQGSGRSEEHTSELQSLMRISYAVFCLKKKTTTQHIIHYSHNTTTTS